jgi:hypothetical protein
MNRRRVFGWLSGLAGVVAAVVVARQPHHGAPVPAPPPSVPVYTLTVHVCEVTCDQDAQGNVNKIPRASVTLDHGAVVRATPEGDADVPNLTAGRYTVCAKAEGWKEFCADQGVPADGAVFLALERDIRVPLIGVSGKYFTDHGEPWTEIETSDFSLYKRYLDGENIDPILAERRDVGFNTLRVWLLNTSVIPGGLQPKDYPQFYAALPAFVDLLGAHGFVVELTAFTQTPLLMPNVNDQRQHWQRTQDAIRGKPNVLLELVNEYNHGGDHPDNAPDRALWTMRPVGILASSGSADADAAPPELVWDYVLYHSNGLSEFQRKVGHNAMEYADKYGVPAVANENTRYPDQDASEQHAFDAAAGGALLAAGSCYHSNAGKFSRLYGDERRFAAAWVAGAKSVPLDFQRGAYLHRADLEDANAIRVYERRLPDGRSFILRVRP